MTTRSEDHAVSAPPKPSFIIRPVTAADRAFILALLPRFVAGELPQGRRKRETLAAIRANFERALREPASDEYCFVSETADHECCGFLRLQLQRDFFSGARDCHISDLAVTPACEGQGLGRALVAFAEQWARRHRCKQLSLSVFPGNIRARALYAHAGFHADLLRLTQPIRAVRTRAVEPKPPRPRTLKSK